MCFGLLETFQGLKKIVKKKKLSREANDSGNSIGHGRGKYRNKTKPSTALESGKTS